MPDDPSRGVTRHDDDKHWRVEAEQPSAAVRGGMHLLPREAVIVTGKTDSEGEAEHPGGIREAIQTVEAAGDAALSSLGSAVKGAFATIKQRVSFRLKSQNREEEATSGAGCSKQEPAENEVRACCNGKPAHC